MKQLLFLFLLLSTACFAKSAEERSQHYLDVWMNNKFYIEGYGLRNDITVKDVKEALNNAVACNLAEIHDIDSGANTFTSRSALYGDVAEINATTFRSLTNYFKYESAMFDLTKEKDLQQQWENRFDDWKNDPYCPDRNYEKTQEEFLHVWPEPTGRVKNDHYDEWRQEYANKAKPYMYLRTEEKKYWRISLKVAVKDKDIQGIDLAKFALNDIAQEDKDLFSKD